MRPFGAHLHERRRAAAIATAGAAIRFATACLPPNDIVWIRRRSAADPPMVPNVFGRDPSLRLGHLLRQGFQELGVRLSAVLPA